MEPYSWEMVGRRFPPFRTLLLALKRAWGLRGSDFLLLRLEEGAGVAVRYRASDDAAPATRGFISSTRADELRLAARMLGIPVFLAPCLVNRMVRVEKESKAGPWPRCRGGIAGAMDRLYRRNPGRYGARWGLGRVRNRVARTLWQRWMLRDTAGADFVVTGKEGFAAALRYEGDCRGPKFLASGHGTFAKAIMAQARENGVPTVEDDFCAGQFSGVARAGSFVPEELWGEAIRVMADLARLDRKSKLKWKWFNQRCEDEGEEWKE